MSACTLAQSIVTSQASKSDTFTLPPGLEEAEIPLPTAWDHHLKYSHSHPLFVYEAAPGQVEIISWKDAVRAMHRSARVMSNHAQKLGLQNAFSSEGNTGVFGILASTDTISYWTVLTGIMRAGFIPFVISPKNSAIAVAHLLKITNCSAVFLAGGEAIQTLAQDAIKSVDYTIELIPFPVLDELYINNDTTGNFEPLPPFPIECIDRIALISHSSGSTSFPKPVYATHRIAAQWALMPALGDADLCGKVIAAHSLPLYHGMGYFIALGWVAGSGLTLGVFNPRHMPNAINSEVTLQGAVATGCTILEIVPSLLEQYAENPDAVETLKKFEMILWGSGPLRENVGDFLVSQGINIVQQYGTTEIGIVTPPNIGLGPRGKDWRYIYLPEAKSHYMKPSGDGLTYELFMLDGEHNGMCVKNAEIEGKPAYETKDLMLQHPVEKDWWRVYGRCDDQIMHSSGEKTNPGPIEEIISRHPSVHACIMFGRGELQAGVLVEPVQEKIFHPDDKMRLLTFRDEIWSSVEEANKFAPKHSRIFKEMIIVTDPSRPFLFTPKGTIRRQLMLKDYQADITSLYLAKGNWSSDEVSLPESQSLDDCTSYISKVVQNLLGKTAGIDEDIFQLGADSLQATSIRNSILRFLRSIDRDEASVSQNFVYNHPTISMLGQALADLANSGQGNEHGFDSTARLMRDMVKEFTISFPAHVATQSIPDLERIVVTGTTGSLGSHILAKLLQTPTVEFVYALNRPSEKGSKSLLDRQTKAFREHGLPLELMESPKLRLLESNTSVPMLGLPLGTFEEIRNSATSIIHNAWKVNFNMALSSFKPLIVGVRNLIDLALSSPLQRPPTIVFISSLGSVAAWKEPTPVPEIVLEDPSVAAGAGYGESKWVSEQIFNIASKKTHLNTVVIRVGQICGNTVSGSWNQWEWFPSIVQSYKTVGCLPETEGLSYWVPVDTAAAAIADVRSLANSTEGSTFLHLAHPHPVHITSIIRPIASLLNVPSVPYGVWLEKIEQALADSARSESLSDVVRENPVFKLMEFYRGAAGLKDPTAEAFIGAKVSVEKTVKLCQTLGSEELGSLSEKDIRLWLGYWQVKGAIQIA